MNLKQGKAPFSYLRARDFPNMDIWNVLCFNCQSLDKKTRDKVENRQIQAELFDEKEFLSSELSSMGKKEFGVEITVYSESDSDIYDPKGKARHARPFKPAILIE